MTIKRNSQEIFDMRRFAVAEYVRKVLSQNPPYKLLKEVQSDKVFEVRFKPYWWAESTYMKVKLEDVESSTRVIVEVMSSRYTFGDVFAFYNKLIDDFMIDLRNHMENIEPKFVYRYNQDTMRLLQLVGLSFGIGGILILLIGLIQSMNLKTFLPGVTILFVISALFLGYGTYETWQHKQNSSSEERVCHPKNDR